MLLGKRSRRMVAATLFTILATDTLAPGISYALTSGPTQPEATSFEPIDTTDMVNLQTGDLAYNIPLIEVPGPEGGYPLSLSYHAGIQTNVDASWVGLGWTLNPGAITRTVSGLPDDWQGLQNNSRTYWQGGKFSSYQVGATIGIAETPFNVSFGLTISQDTYKGFGVDFDASIGDGPFSLGVSKDANSGAKLTGGINTGGESQNGEISSSMGLSFSTNFKSLEAGMQCKIDLFGFNFMEASMSTGSKSSMSVRGEGEAAIQGSKNAGIQTSHSGFDRKIPITKLLSIHLAFSKTRYWTDENATTTAVGSFYPQNWNPGGDNVFDTYSMLEDPSSKNIVVYPDPTVLQGGAIPAFDEYNVSGQGLGGNMRPYFFQGGVMGQNHKDQDGHAYDTYYHGYVSGSPQQFRFIEDFSNAFRQQYLPYSSSALSQDFTSGVPALNHFDPAPLFGNTNGATDYGNGTTMNNYGASSVNHDNLSAPDFMALAGSRHIDIGVKVQPSNIQGYNPTDYYHNGMITGFSITNESGVTYHYGLPAYSYGEENYQERIDSKGLNFNRSIKGNAYAYTWYLTSITGPDYVDRNNDGHAGTGDWGYWVNFEYGKWSDAYAWRNPSEGLQRDDDNKFQNCSMGYRQIYYLNAIRTRSHVALFEKDARYDAKGSSPLIFSKNSSTPSYQYPDGRFDGNSGLSMRLNRIYLLNAADGNMVTPSSGTNPPYTSASRTIACNCEMGANVLDRTDVDAVGRVPLEAKSIRVIDFSYDYSLCSNTRNSFDPNAPSTPMGKLALKALTFKGKGGATSMPSMQFSYELPAANIKTATGTVSATSFTTSTPVFQTGDLLQSGGTFYGVVTSYNASTNIYSLANSSFPASSGSVTQTLSTTKNPPYNKDAYDMWGMYKSNYDPTLLSNNENLGRNTDAVSAQATDAWSLRAVTTQLGDVLQLNYGPDTYHQVAMSNTYSLVMKNISVVPNTNNAITFQLENYGSSINPGSIVQVGSVFQRLALLVHTSWSCSGCYSKGTITPGPVTITNMATNTDGSITYTGMLNTPIVASGFNGSIFTGNLWVDQNSDYYGGGIRVASLTISHTFDNSASTFLYNYNNPSGYSSGVTTYLPTVLEAFDEVAARSNPGGLNYGVMDAWIYYYKKTLYQNAGGLYPLAQLLPAPGVMYEYVTVTNQFSNPDESAARNIPGSTQYRFEVFKNNMVGREEVNPMQQATGSDINQFARNWVLRRFTSCIGNIRQITQFDAAGRMLAQTVNHYLHDGLENLGFHDFMTQYQSRLAQFNYQGLIQERYEEIKKIPVGYVNPNKPPLELPLPGNPDSQPLGGVRATMTAREEYPCIQIGQTTTNYVSGVQTSSQNLAFDFYSGAVTKKVATDAYGNSFMTSTVSAYQQYPALGIKVNNDNNANMLTQTAATYTYKVDNNNHPLGLVSAIVNTWSNTFSAMDIDGTTHIQDGRTESSGSSAIPNGNVWRTQSTYDWMPTTRTSDGLTPLAGFSDFSWTSPSSSDARWVKTADITLYDVFSKTLEARDMNNNYSATHMNYGEQKVALTGGPANYSEMAYSGAEDAGVNQTNTAFVQAAGGVVSTAAAHTGARSLLLAPSGTRGFLYTVNTARLALGRAYTAAVWVKPVSGTNSTVRLYYDIDGTVKGSSIASGSSTKTAGGWSLINLTLTAGDIASGSVLHVWCQNDDASLQAYVDDMRFQPVNASTTAYVYDPFSGELTYILNNNNLYTRFEYDAAGQLVRTYKEKLNTGTFANGEFKTNQYTYNYGAVKYGNNPNNNDSYTKNNCNVSAGYAGTSMNVDIPADTYTSFISRADADAQAAIYAQDYANLHASCVCSPGFRFISGTTGTIDQVSISGTRVTLGLIFAFPSFNFAFDVGDIVGSCAFPSATRTVPITIGATLINFTIFPSGHVMAQLMSGPAPDPYSTFTIVYDTQTVLYYSSPASGTFAKNDCAPGQTGTSSTYTVPAGAFISSISQQDANNQAAAYAGAIGQYMANIQGSCSFVCGFTWASGITADGYEITSSPSDGTMTFSLIFYAPPFPPGSNTYTGGILGTITGPCRPSAIRPVLVTEDNGRTWSGHVYPDGTIQIDTPSGAWPSVGDMITLQGTINL